MYFYICGGETGSGGVVVEGRDWLIPKLFLISIKQMQKYLGSSCEYHFFDSYCLKKLRLQVHENALSKDDVVFCCVAGLTPFLSLSVETI
jgi:hypothetical protein